MGDGFDIHQARADREGISREEAKRRNWIEGVSAPIRGVRYQELELRCLGFYPEGPGFRFYGELKDPKGNTRPLNLDYSVQDLRRLYLETYPEARELAETISRKVDAIMSVILFFRGLAEIEFWDKVALDLRDRI